MKSTFRAFGLHFTDTHLRTAFLERGKGKLGIVSFSEDLIPPEMVTQGVIQNPKQFGAFLRETLRKSGGRRFPEHAVVALPDTQCYVFTVVIDSDETENLAEAVRWEASQHLPFPLEEAYLDWSVQSYDQGKQVIQVAAAPKEIVSAYVEALDVAAIKPLSLLPSSLATMQAITSPAEGTSSLLLLLDATSTTLSLFTDRVVPLSLNTTLFSDRELTSLLVKKLKLSDEEAAKAKEVCGLDPTVSQGVVRDALTPSLKELVEKITELCRYGKQRLGYTNCSSIFLVGEGARLRLLDQELQKRTHIPTTTNVIRKDVVMFNPSKKSTTVAFPTLATAIGLSVTNL